MVVTVLLCVAFAAPAAEPAAFSAGNEELRQYMAEAADTNPELKARHAEWEALLARVPQVTALDDPMFTYTQYLQSDQRKYGIRLEQKFPWFGTLRARGDRALAEADAALSRFYAARNETFAAVKRAYFEYWALGENIRIADEQTKIIANVEELIKSRYGLGLASQSDLFRIEIEKDKLDDLRKGLAQSRGSLSARLAAALGREAGEDLPWPQAADFPPAFPAEEEVLKAVKASNPGVASIKHMVESWEKEAIVAKKRGFPEFSVEFGYEDMKDMKDYGNRMNAALASESAKMFAQTAPNDVGMAWADVAYNAGRDFYLREPGDVRDDLMVSLRVSLPIWRKKIRAGISEANLMKASVQHDKHKLELALVSGAKDAMFGIQDAQRRYTLYKESLITKEYKTYESLLSEYGAQVDAEPSGTAAGAGFVDIQDSVKALLEFQLEQVRAARDWQVAAADLEMIMGGPWGN